MLRSFPVAVCFALASFSSVAAQTTGSRPPDGTYIYRWNQNGTLAGQSTVVIKTRGAHVSMRTDTNVTGITLSGGTLVFGSKMLEFDSYTGFATANGLDTSIDIKLANGLVTGTTKNQSVTNSVSVTPSAFAPVVAVDDGALGTFLMVPAQLNARNATNFQLIPIASGIVGTVLLSTSQTGPYPFGIPTTDVVGSFGVNTTLWYNPQTFVVDQFTRGPLVATLVGHH
jgi:hypothetical protein